MGDPKILAESEWRARTEEMFGHYETAYIIGKGPTFRDPMPKSKNDKTFILGVNEAVNRIQHPDAVMVQDRPVWSNITAMHKLKYCIKPLFSIEKGIWSTDFTDAMWLETLQLYGFNGIGLTYSNLNSEAYKHLDSKNGEDELMKPFSSTGYQCCGFVRSFLPNVKKVITHGIACEPKRGLTYHRLFQHTRTYQKYVSKGFYHISRLLMQETFKNTNIELEIL